jgi:hypothetical protein
MIINSDERQTTWMDEGVDSFVQLLTELERYPQLDWSRGRPAGIVPYMKGDKEMMRPLMTSGEQVVQSGVPNNMPRRQRLCSSYAKRLWAPSYLTASFKEYAQRWAFKHPKPSDFFRTMEDASAVDLDWFWRGWFYTTDNCDMTLDDVKWFKVRKDQTTLENKTKSATKGDLATKQGGDAKPNDFSQGPQYFSVTPNR